MIDLGFREIVFDLETTGTSVDDRIIEIGAIELVNRSPTGSTYQTLVNPDGRKSHWAAKRKHRIRSYELLDQPLFAEVAADFLAFVGESQLIAHNCFGFDQPMLNAELERAGLKPIPANRFRCTLEMARSKFGGRHSLDALCDRFAIKRSHRNAHRALIDCELLAELYVELEAAAPDPEVSIKRERRRLEREMVHHVRRALTELATTLDRDNLTDDALRSIRESTSLDLGKKLSAESIDTLRANGVSAWCVRVMDELSKELDSLMDNSSLCQISQTFRGQDKVKKRRGRNLFAIDYESIDSTLTEANGILLERRDVLMTDFGLLPESLQTMPDIDVAQDFAKKINELLDEARRARLDDGRPFTEASKTVKGFFDRIDGPLKAILAELTSRITDAAKKQQQLAALAAANNATVSSATAPITAHTGKPIATVVSIQSGTPSVPALEWVVEDFDRQNLDLDALRPYLTDAAILAACKKHLEAYGPDKLRGVMYDQRAVTG